MQSKEWRPHVLSRQALKTALTGPTPPQTSSSRVQLLHQIEFQPFPRPQPIPEAPRPPKPLRVLIGSQSWPGGGYRCGGKGWSWRSVPGRGSGHCAGVDGKGDPHKPSLATGRPPAFPRPPFSWALRTPNRPAFPAPVNVWARPPRGAGHALLCT